MKISFNKAVELSKTGDKDSLTILLNQYIEDNSNDNTIKNPLIRTRGDLCTLIDEKLNQKMLSHKQEYKLLQLAFRKNPKKYLYGFLKSGININNIKGLVKSLENIDVSYDCYKDIILAFIVENEYYERWILQYLTQDIRYKQKLQEKIFEYLLDNDFVDNKLITYVLQDEDYRALAKEYIYHYLVNQNDMSISLLDHIIEENIYYEQLQEPLNAYITKLNEENEDVVLKYYYYLDYTRKSNLSLLEQYISDIGALYCIFSSIDMSKNILALQQSLDENILFTIGIMETTEINVDQAKRIENYSIEQVIIEDKISKFLKCKIQFLVYVAGKDRGLAEKLLFLIHNKIKSFSSIALDALSSLNSQIAYREMINVMLTTLDSTKKYTTAIALINKYPDKCEDVLSYIQEANEQKLYSVIKEKVEQKGITPNLKEKLLHKKDEEINSRSFILESDVLLNEYINSIARRIGIKVFQCATGFLYSSGLKLLQPCLENIKHNEGEICFIIGALNDYFRIEDNESESKLTKMDLNTAKYLNQIRDEYGMQYFTYTPSFYHGKFYYMAGEKEVYVIIGSSNISKTAFLDNKELNMVYTFEVGTEQDEYFKKWYHTFRSECILLPHLNETYFQDNIRDVEGGGSRKEKLEQKLVQNQIDSLTDEETKYRLNLWMQRNPSNIYGKLDIGYLEGYIVYEYRDINLLVLESFAPNNAYYCFNGRDVDLLLEEIRYMSKAQIPLYNNFLSRGYHIQNRSNLNRNIDRVFEQVLK